MNVEVKLFASARERLGAEAIRVEVDGNTVGDLRNALTAAYPELAPILQQSLFAINTDYADDATVIHVSDEVACIPPVSGG